MKYMRFWNFAAVMSCVLICILINQEVLIKLRMKVEASLVDANDTIFYTQNAHLGSVLKKRHNVLFIMADDMRAQLECYQGKDYLFQQPKMKTPNFNKLAARSLLLLNGFVQFAKCGPSRTSMLTGRRPDTTRVFHNGHYWRSYSGDFTTIPQHFKNNGYTSVGVGKIFHLGSASNQSDPPSWTHPFIQTHNSDKIYMRNSSNTRWVQVPEDRLGEIPLGDIITVQHAKQYLRNFSQLVQNHNPFFIAVGFYKPHASQACPSTFFDKYPIDSEQSYLTPREELHSHIDDQTSKGYIRAYCACISFVDYLLGEILETLQETGLEDSTIVSFVSDHGYHFGEHGIMGKSQNYDMTLRVPMMIHIPGVTNHGIVSGSIVEAIDLFPTLVEAAGLDPLPKCPNNSSTVQLCVEGESFLPLIDKPEEELKGEAFSQQGKTDLLKQYSIRTPRYRLVQHAARKPENEMYNFNDKDFQLYDHLYDPKEYFDVGNDPSYKDVVKELQHRLKNFANKNN